MINKLTNLEFITTFDALVLIYSEAKRALLESAVTVSQLMDVRSTYIANKTAQNGKNHRNCDASHY